MNPRYPAVARRAGHLCEYCRAPEALFNFAFEVEHIVPSSQDGEDDLENLALACRSCNLYKGDHQTGIDEATQQQAPLFHPRRNHWEEHFRVETETAILDGVTSAGRATIARLQMNSPIQVAARRQWMRLGLFP